MVWAQPVGEQRPSWPSAPLPAEAAEPMAPLGHLCHRTMPPTCVWTLPGDSAWGCCTRHPYVFMCIPMHMPPRCVWTLPGEDATGLLPRPPYEGPGDPWQEEKLQAPSGPHQGSLKDSIHWSCYSQTPHLLLSLVFIFEIVV